MEQTTQNLLEMIDRPAFLVADGLVKVCNASARHRQFLPGAPIARYLTADMEAYSQFTGGVLYLTLETGDIRCGTTVTRQEYGDIFLLDRDADQLQLQALALAGVQLRAPLSDLMTLADQLFPQLQEENQKEMAAQMYKAIFQLLRQSGNMADSQRYAAEQTTNFENTELCSFFRDIFEKADAQLKSTARISFTTSESHLFTLADRERLERAAWNLLSNGVKFSPPGSTIAVKLTKSGSMACLTVENPGDGIAAHVQSSLFYRYLREPAIEDSRFGLGLGMTLVHSAAAIHGGTVLLEQQGSTKVAMTIALRSSLPGALQSPRLRIGDYAGGRDLGLLEFSEILPAAFYEES